MLSGKEKIYFLLNRIDDRRVLTPLGQPILLHPFGDLSGNYSDIELRQLLLKLQNDDKIFRIVRIPETNDWGIPDYENEVYGLELLPKFDEYFAKIQNEPEYQDFIGKKPTTVPQDKVIVQSSQPAQQNSDVVYKITYTKAREVLINDLLQLAKPNFDNENDLVFQFLYDNPNKKWTLKEIQEKVCSITKTLHKIVENLGFVGDFKKVFFDVSETAICFKNPITKGELEKLGIKQIKLPR